MSFLNARRPFSSSAAHFVIAALALTAIPAHAVPRTLGSTGEVADRHVTDRCRPRVFVRYEYTRVLQSRDALLDRRLRRLREHVKPDSGDRALCFCIRRYKERRFTV